MIGRIVRTKFGDVVVTDVSRVLRGTVVSRGIEVEFREDEYTVREEFGKSNKKNSSSLREIVDQLYEKEVELAKIQAEVNALRQRLKELMPVGTTYEDDRITVIHVSPPVRKVYDEWFKTRVEFLKKMADVKGHFEEVKGDSYISVRRV